MINSLQKIVNPFKALHHSTIISMNLSPKLKFNIVLNVGGEGTITPLRSPSSVCKHSTSDSSYIRRSVSTLTDVYCAFS